ncbi:hypothetical protein EDD18DRAFT_1353985 [Armillaria luteobubalina]|uniref:Uncharacterized protein n=1 Tax=Armillaria luteobubalina TaxID=153913 RepID=A0AA39Q3E6_9AGAR|nr:hypothetical protein EDD18DRAFT_1353985 [Armillaria luteobubalina]
MVSSYINCDDTNVPPPPYTPRQDGVATKPDPVARIDSLLDSFRALHHEQNLPHNSKLYVTRQPESMLTEACVKSISPSQDKSPKRRWYRRLLRHV